MPETLFLGRFDTEKEASEVYKKAVQKYHGKYSRGGSGARDDVHS